MRLYNWKIFNESKEDIESICLKYEIENWTIQDGLVNVDGDVNLFNKKLTKLPLNFGEVTGDFFCSWNPLTSLKGCPQKVSGNFYCHENQLNTLEGCPQKVNGNFYCHENKLTTLIGGPQEVLGDYYCSWNKLIDVRGFPEYYRGDVYINGNPVEEIIKLFQGIDTDIIIETLNDYNVIRKGKKVDLQLLKYAFDELEIPMPKIEYIKGYEII